ncbi:hypothetical protein DERF_005579 [Dermatophagoides farinae]|uniref:UDP-glucuronosyltransferase n=1 Tax=Dermatophagoides farinae TaxID=6954 RepID=A0A922I9R7_DERFA|nr:uncharacterized UDP-glucosyltransferase YjiC-like [Dermatophagoides farinae]KAH7639417.1 hypothetical protein HUG17_3450 [Dermatophagoides farinae]KAH9521973.1 hypothetical protein DERF_005579 [Dermatophagoides farinae]
MTQTMKNIVVISLNAVGHVNGCRGATIDSLISRGHRVYFLLEKAFEGQLRPYGFEEIIYEVSNDRNEPTKKPGEQMANDLLSYKILGKMTVEEKLRQMLKYFVKSDTFLSYYQQVEISLKRLMRQIQIDLFIIDDVYIHPAIYYSNIPVIKCITSAPFIFFASDPALPPPFTGLPSNADPDEMNKCRQMLADMMKKNAFADYIEKLGYEKYPDDQRELEKRIAFNIYAYPKELNHWKIESAHPRWFNLEVFNRNIQYDTIDLEELVGQDFYHNDLDGKFSGKWIYVSMGSMGSVDLELMQRLTLILAKTQHKYIISKGPRHDEYELPGKNMWGARFIPQIKILPLIDLVITHGGNNTVTETFAQGKPMIIMPLFCDQLDNGQRLVETGLGVCLEPYDFDEQQLLSSIDRLLMDKKLADKLYRASERIKKSEAHRLFGEKVEQLMNE